MHFQTYQQVNTAVYCVYLEVYQLQVLIYHIHIGLYYVKIGKKLLEFFFKKMMFFFSFFQSSKCSLTLSFHPLVLEGFKIVPIKWEVKEPTIILKALPSHSLDLSSKLPRSIKGKVIMLKPNTPKHNTPQHSPKVTKLL